ncbi:MAG: hypothetical protein HYZ45_07240 [Burkholderiales bacterium]|nr:hypothetical protein [Burkholderiales bacterium]
MDLIDNSAARRAARAKWPVIKASLSAMDESESPIYPIEALSMMWQLAVDAWAMTDRPLPTYSRDETPVTRINIATKNRDTPS